MEGKRRTTFLEQCPVYYGKSCSRGVICKKLENWSLRMKGKVKRMFKTAFLLKSLTE
jgi:hypothetical protein